MATIGLRDLYVAKVTKDSSEGTTYDTPMRLAKAITAELSIEVLKQVLYADDAGAETITAFKSGTLKLSTSDIEQEMLAMLLGSRHKEGQVVHNANDLSIDVAVGFRALKSDGRFRYVWLYKVNFAIPNESYQTKGEAIEFKVPELEGTILTRANGDWKTDVVANAEKATSWFAAVQEMAV